MCGGSISLWSWSWAAEQKHSFNASTSLASLNTLPLDSRNPSLGNVGSGGIGSGGIAGRLGVVMLSLDGRCELSTARSTRENRQSLIWTLADCCTGLALYVTELPANEGPRRDKSRSIITRGFRPRFGRLPASIQCCLQVKHFHTFDSRVFFPLRFKCKSLEITRHNTFCRLHVEPSTP